ncbi:amino acid-binding protein [Nonomuraea indica]|uniref:ACT domain-containing protein n=1 Tax=Nonomuraea indica TaxID=1581193 RepID=A0ABW8A7N1_9ACTN|nr:amino acid-binding protein [Nonomuraea indica]
MSTDLAVILNDKPGELARLGQATGQAGVNIKGLAAFTGDGKGVVHLLLDDDAVARCRQAVQGAGMGIADERQVLVVDIDDRPGTLGELTRQLAEANVNIDLAYTVFGGVKVVIATDDLENAVAALDGTLGEQADTVSIWDQPA